MSGDGVNYMAEMPQEPKELTHEEMWGDPEKAEVVEKEQVRLPAHAVIGAEMIDPHARRRAESRKAK